MTLKTRISADKKFALRNFLFAFPVLFISFSALAQQQLNDSSDTYNYILEEKTESVAENVEDNTDYTTLLDPLNYYHEHPIDLNHTSQKELKELSLLNDIQISALLNHIGRNGKLIALEELQTIDGFDAETIKRLLSFVTLNNSREHQKITPNKILTEGNHRLLLRYQQVLEGDYIRNVAT